MLTAPEKVAAFRRLHQPGAPFVIPNAWDAGSARILQGLGAKALATTSSGFALTLGHKDYGVSRDEALAHCRLVAGSVDIPLSADLENGFGLSPEDAAATIRAASETGLAGGSIEDTSRDAGDPIIDQALAIERIAAAAEAARAARNGFVLTARAEGLLWGRGDLTEIIARLQAFDEAGADVLFAPGLPDIAAVRTVCAALSKPFNFMVGIPGKSFPISELEAAGVKRISLATSLYR
ncbi:MAG TPA: isocitrate lyase/phosphoenolpyruvate mutase family protein, partial [Burkholderiales bacterium]|nr:isocitrate lyase/phosphoenolpyruvate mutase family protein [Burkholderiales bacterium]